VSRHVFDLPSNESPTIWFQIFHGLVIHEVQPIHAQPEQEVSATEFRECFIWRKVKHICSDTTNYTSAYL